MSELPDEVSFLVTVRRQEGESLRFHLGVIRRAIISKGEDWNMDFAVGGVLRDGVEQPRVWWDE